MLSIAFVLAVFTLTPVDGQYGNCQDTGNYIQCYTGYITGQCYGARHNEMLTNCRRTCDLCHVPIPTKRPKDGPCVDKNKKCKGWSRYCEEDSRWFRYMKKNCRATCKLCSTCKDSHRSCPSYKRRGYCQRSSVYYKFMSKSCPKTCFFCSNKPQKPTPPPQPAVEVKEFECDFEQHECDWWNQPLDDTADWATGRLVEGPTGGHRDGKNYLYLDAIHVHQKAAMNLYWEMILPVNNTQRGQMCFKFHYHMSGGTFSVKQGKNPTSSVRPQPSLLFSRRNPTENWTPAEVNVNVNMENFLVIEGIKEGRNSHVAMDSFYFVKGICR